MKIRPIKTDADHREALAEIERLMDAVPGTLAGDRLEVLTTLVEHYESLHEPIEPPGSRTLSGQSCPGR
jgi:antitoxin component HigA of HigAB toxin-antitoxin module